MKWFHKVFFGTFGVVILIGILISIKKREAIMANNSITSGYFLEMIRGVKTGGGIKYSYFLEGKKYVELSPSPPVACQRLLRANKQQLGKVKFPVIYELSDPSHSEILMFYSQYEKYNLAVPDSMMEIVMQLSSCE